MKNDIFKEYSEKIFNKDLNYQEIVYKKNNLKNYKKNFIKKALSAVAIFLIVFSVGMVSNSIYAAIKWNIEFKEYQNRSLEIGRAYVSEEEKEGYMQKVDMDYITQDGIGVKIDSIITTDDKIEANINFSFDENIEVASEEFSFSCIIYDEENNVYGIWTRILPEDGYNYIKCIYRELGIKCGINSILPDVALSSEFSLRRISAENRNIITQINFNSIEGFPKSKKIYIRVFNLGYTLFDIEAGESYLTLPPYEDFSLSDAEWIFELDMPEKFYNRETISLSLAEELPGVEFSKIDITELGTVIKGKYKDLNEFLEKGKDEMSGSEWGEAQDNFIYLTDGEGNKYYPTNFGGSGADSTFHCRFDLGKSVLEKKLYLNHSVNGNLYTSELIQK